ncbi:MAG: helix-turn-helix transcriptional regulator [Clostridiales bacterium]|nr:helix-turn-helix transcriptional regulator [Clostridiales bacterium]
MEEYKRNIAENITQLRQAKNLTQAQLAEKLNYSDKAVSKWERGESFPDVFILKQLCELFGVTIDYLFHTHKKEDIVSKAEHIKTNHKIITLISIVGVWFLATLIFSIIKTWFPNVAKLWLAYVFAVPVSFIVLLVFNSIWGRKRYNYLIISGLSWSIILAVYISFFSQNYWLLFMIGIPGQIIIILTSKLKKRK